MSSSAFVPNFLPSMSGFHFPNNPPNFPAITITLPGGQSIGIGSGLVSRGLCGGFSFAAKDFFDQAVLMFQQFAPTGTQGVPAGGTPIFQYLLRRQVDSFNVQLGFASDALKWVIWPLLPTHDTLTSGITGIHGLSYLMVHDEVPKILADLNQGSLSPIGLVEPSVGSGHQVLAWGYTLDDASNLNLFVYDSNQPEIDDATISLNIGQSYNTIPITATQITNILGSPIVGIFRQNYNPPNSPGYALDLATFGGPTGPTNLQPLAPSWRPWNRFGIPPGGVNLQAPVLAPTPGFPSPIGLTPGTGPAACSWEAGRLDVFVQDDFTNIDHFWWANGTPNWEAFNQSSLTYPTAASWGPNRIDLFTVMNGLDYSLIHYWFDGVWHPWESLSQPGSPWDGTPRIVNNNYIPWGYPNPRPNMYILTPPAACSWGPNHLDVFLMSGARAPGGGMPGSSNDWYLRQLTWDNGWSQWKDVPGIIRITPGGGFSAASWGVGRIDLFAIDVTGNLCHRWYANSQWNGPASAPTAWENLGAPPAGLFQGASPSAASWAENRIDVFALGASDSALWHIWYDGQWHPWESLGGFLQAPPGAVAWTEGHLDVFSTAQDFNLWHLWFQSD